MKSSSLKTSITQSSLLSNSLSKTTSTPVKTSTASSNKFSTSIITKTVTSIQTTITTQKETKTVTSVQQITSIQQSTKTVTVYKESEMNKIMKACYRNNRKVEFTKYWIPKENEWDETNNGKKVYLGGKKNSKLLDKNKKEIASVTLDMYNKCKMEGTCLLENGDLINLDDDSDAFMKIGKSGREHNVFGLGSGSQNLVPFISVAANDLPYGQKLYIPELDGVDLGEGITHNGCVRVDDVSTSFESCQIDFFVLSYVHYLWLDLDEKVTIRYDDKCQLKNYITINHLASFKASLNEKIIPSLLDAKYHQD